ncbi:helix-turn-helix domain-containing protein [Niallia circulans]|jgi:uncharacterized membrane protein YkvA (DUF1232 family)/plasmid maintenance system antidote protein VapI|uniref:helix-turn-helix domain-containing protein n=1 Tax=Niallia circulans TaxID=1397 RepID=UPI0035232BD5
MSDTNEIGLLLKNLLKKNAMSMRKLSVLTNIDTATISRIINGKRRPTPEHIQKFAKFFDYPVDKMFTVAGYLPSEASTQSEDIFDSVESIQSELFSSNHYKETFSIKEVQEQLQKYNHYALTDEGKGLVADKFTEKVQKVEGVGPFIQQLKEYYQRFSNKKGNIRELAVMGAALIYFIISVDVIPDYIFPIGYLDDAVAIKISAKLLPAKG